VGDRDGDFLDLRFIIGSHIAEIESVTILFIDIVHGYGDRVVIDIKPGFIVFRLGSVGVEDSFG
jgi:hypothetical protein